MLLIFQLAKFYRFLIISLILCALIPATALAHRGAADEIDYCKLSVGKEGKVHFTAYTPTISGSEEFCKEIPNIGPTNLVFDYVTHDLRNLTVEFEITKEPDGTRIYYQAPKKVKTGTVNVLIDFAKHGAGDYLAHVTVVNNGEKFDTHLPFIIGKEPEVQINYMKYVLYTLIFLVTATLIITLYRNEKNTDMTE